MSYFLIFWFKKHIFQWFCPKKKEKFFLLVGGGSKASEVIEGGAGPGDKSKNVIDMVWFQS